ncbi:MAG: OadG-related small transporter subunit [Collinsella sp.]|nr:OadG-related small transporter subunit [Collinsella sp.]
MPDIFSSDLMTAVEILFLGWGGIFFVMLIIYVVSMGLARFFPPKTGE